MPLDLTAGDRDLLAGEEGAAAAMAMRIVTALATANGASRLIDISSAHIDGTLYVGRASLDYAARLRDLGGRVRVRTTLNVSSLDLLHPELFRGDDTIRRHARQTMQAYEDMGCLPTWTCAPYQLPERPGFGERIAWAESNAIVFANSVLGARTERFGDFIDIAVAITGRAPEYGMYLDEHRRASVHYDVGSISPTLRRSDHFFAVLGIAIGRDVGREIPVITGIDEATEDQLKLLGAGAATTGTVPLFHVVGVTPEAPTMVAATGGVRTRDVHVTSETLAAARDSLSTADPDETLTTVNLGTPHYSVAQIARLADLLGGRTVHERITLYVNTARDTLAAAPDVAALERCGVQFVTDTCTYLTPIIETGAGVAMSDSAKWAYYAPGNIGVTALFGTTADCVESAVAGRVVRDESSWQ